ncbi:subunit of TIM23 translocase complex [Coemansia sp. RSA 1290]|nr:reactive mitochondrial oxygen species modulator 1-domain-containing protein [Coemansia mojavensis]KAJ1740876.1 subunit of TIM23 translocase complex [Coemansia sp. RSA 1086]KAJ1749192.1 subunit of TIM23 translocase complex [Coemansia sp. RSA 1821]KAJ1873062.1 subunit of TIM23 translocase complex [Coemansia sp. RSA 990]KAJ2630925.1 subunit of TIM23 translocase complex [Coemansia sp. RSA 1290]KAJ2647862.1 subunit of TIM23 translocase complex [Coemansia sp. RSA 1250]KAJ2673341.1 subunit of TIM
MSYQPSIWDKAKMGLIMGGSVGACLGCLIGFYSTMKFGPGPRGYLGTIGQYALGSGASFGFFMMIGSCIRSDDSSVSAEDCFALKAAVERWNTPTPMAYYLAQAKSKST